ncbi:MAG TPA: SRPBCC family protein [Cyclobacteriaceae bacterium]|nr:SRPBCC family protein [Cyclobacteriaceae bacterium]
MTNPITISAQIKGDLRKVWDYYTLPEHITQWNFADPSWHCPWATNDMQPGGKYIARMEARDGSFGFDFGAVYDQIDTGKSFSYTIGDGRKVMVQFNDKGAVVELVVSFEPEQQNPVELQRGGWQSILNNFKHYAESRK